MCTFKLTAKHLPVPSKPYITDCGQCCSRFVFCSHCAITITVRPTIWVYIKLKCLILINSVCESVLCLLCITHFVAIKTSVKMRLSPVTTIKSKHLFPTSRLSLLKNSNDKLNDIIVDDCKDLPGLLASKAHHLAKQWYDQTEDHRRRLWFHLRKNWIRLLLSAMVLMAQFLWFTSNFTVQSNTEPHQQQQPHHHSDLVVSNSPQSDLQKQSDQQVESWHLLDYGVLENNHSDNDQQDQAMMIASFDANFVEQDNNPLPSQHHSRPSLWSWVGALLWKAFFLCKLAFIMLCFELVRLSDTVVNVIRQINDEEDEKQRASPKSPVDTRYIERNRGYKWERYIEILNNSVTQLCGFIKSLHTSITFLNPMFSKINRFVLKWIHLPHITYDNIQLRALIPIYISRVWHPSLYTTSFTCLQSSHSISKLATHIPFKVATLIKVLS